MPAITLKNIPDDLYAQLKRSAEVHHRSINREIIVCIERAVRSRAISPEAVLVQARQLREMTGDYTSSDAEITQAKGAGRP